jgi:hypothetical protein
MPRFRVTGAQRDGMTVAGFFEAFKCEALGRQTGNRNEANAPPQQLLELDPLFRVEFRCQAVGGSDALRFAGSDGGDELRAERIVFRPELLDPRFEDLRVADRAKPTEKFAPGFAHLWPSGMRVNLLYNRCKRAAAANGHAEIVDGIFVRPGAQLLQFVEDALHPMR